MAQEDKKKNIEEKKEEYKDIKGMGFFKKVKYSIWIFNNHISFIGSQSMAGICFQNNSCVIAGAWFINDEAIG